MTPLTNRPIASTHSALEPIARLLRHLARWLGRSSHARLDVENLSPHLQRDLGFRDGREPAYEPAETR